MKRIIGRLGIILLLSGCASVGLYRGPLPSQDISSPAPGGLTRVIFFNSGDPRWLSGQVQIEIDGQAGPLIQEYRYFQAFLSPGRHTLKTEHIDSFAWTAIHEISVENTDLFIKISRRLTGQDVMVVNELPAKFEEKYRAVRPKL